MFGVKPVIAVGTDLAYGAVTKTVGGYEHFSQRTVDLGLSSWMAVGSVPAAIGGVISLEALQRAHGKSFDDLMLKVLAAALLLTGAATLATAAHLLAGNVDFGIAGNILVGSVPGVWLGSHWSVRVPAGALRTALALLLLGSGLGLLSKANVGVPPAVLAGVPAVVAAVVAGAALAQRRNGRKRAPEPAAPTA